MRIINYILLTRLFKLLTSLIVSILSLLGVNQTSEPKKEEDSLKGEKIEIYNFSIIDNFCI